MMKRSWEDRTLVEEYLIALLQEVYNAWNDSDDEEVEELLLERQEILDEAFDVVPWTRAANDSAMPLGAA